MRGLQRNKKKVIELLEPYLKLGLSINKAKFPEREIIKFTGTIYRKLVESTTEEDFNNIPADYKKRNTRIVEDNT